MSSIDFALQTVNFLLATAQWLILGRLVMRPMIRNPRNAVWQVFLITTDPPYRVSRALTQGRVSERWIWLVSLVWLMVGRLAVAWLRAQLRG
jgi:hypothetical protein